MSDISEYNTTNIQACSIIGIAVKLLFGNNYSKDGSNGPASSVLWGYGLVTISIFFLMFVSHITRSASAPIRIEPFFG